MKQIPLTKGFFALVDDEDFDWLNQWKWTLSNNGYAYRRPTVAKNKLGIIYMHRLICGTPKGFHTDHIDHNGLNNQRHNLRVATPSQNAGNSRLSALNTSGVKGVARHSANRYIVQIRIEGKVKYLGLVKTLEEGDKLYREASIKYRKEFANV